MCYSLFLYGLINWMFKSIPVKNEEGCRWIRVHMQWWGGVVASIHVYMMGGGGQSLAFLEHTYLLNDPIQCFFPVKDCAPMHLCLTIDWFQ